MGSHKELLVETQEIFSEILSRHTKELKKLHPLMGNDTLGTEALKRTIPEFWIFMKEKSLSGKDVIGETNATRSNKRKTRKTASKENKQQLELELT